MSAPQQPPMTVGQLRRALADFEPDMMPVVLSHEWAYRIASVDAIDGDGPAILVQMPPTYLPKVTP